MLDGTYSIWQNCISNGNLDSRINSRYRPQIHAQKIPVFEAIHALAQKTEKVTEIHAQTANYLSVNLFAATQKHGKFTLAEREIRARSSFTLKSQLYN